MKQLSYFIYTLLFLIALSIVNNTFAAVPPVPPVWWSVGPPCWPPPCVPIDGGLSFLLLAGAAYGGKKVYDISKDKEKAE